MKYFFFLIFLFDSILTYGQLSVKPISGTSEGNDAQLSFPVVVSTQQPALAKKIYAKLLADALDLPAESTSEQVQDAMQSWWAHSYQVLENNNKIFSIQLNRSAMHNIPDNKIYVFDVHTGDLLDMNKMFTSKISIVKKSLLEEWKARIKGHLNDERAEDFKTCLEEANKLTGLEISEIHLTNTGFEFEGTSCLEVNAFATEGDTRDPFTRSFNQVWFALNPYGLSFFIEPSTTGSIYNVVLHGTIDQKYPLSIILFLPKQSSAEVEGLEIYDKFGENISLKGKVDGNNVVMQEMTNDGKPQARLEGIWDGTKWQGTFTNIKTGKALSLQLTAQR